MPSADLKTTVQAVVKGTLHGLYHIGGYAIPEALLHTLVRTPEMVFESAFGMNELMVRRGRRILIEAAYSARHRRCGGGAPFRTDNTAAALASGAIGGGEAAAGANAGELLSEEEKTAFSPVDFFGFAYHPSFLMREQGFSTEIYPDPMYNGHVHTILGAMRPSRTHAGMGYQREVVQSDFDGCTLCIDWCLAAETGAAAPNGVIVIIPGLSSCSQSSYIQRFVERANRRGFHCAVAITRGMGDTPLDRPQFACASFTADVDFVLNRHITDAYITMRFGKTIPKIAVGFSLGGAVLIKHLGEVREKSTLHAAAAVCSPWEFHDSANAMLRPLQCATYQKSMTQGLHRYATRHADVFLREGSNVGLNKVLTDLKDGRIVLPTVNDFDREVVCRAFGYANTSEYYNDANCFRFLPRVEVPLMCFTACDDPVTGTPPPFRRWSLVCSRNPNLLYVSCPVGGHLGFLQSPMEEAKGIAAENYMERRVLEAITKACQTPAPTRVRRPDVPDRLEESHHRTATAADEAS